MKETRLEITNDHTCTGCCYRNIQGCQAPKEKHEECIAAAMADGFNKVFREVDNE